MSLRLIKLPTRLVKDLRKISKISTKQKWEYGGRLLFDDTYTYTGFTRVTSKERARIDSSVLESEWNSTFTYHTHPGIFSRPNMEDVKNGTSSPPFQVILILKPTSKGTQK